MHTCWNSRAYIIKPAMHLRSINRSDPFSKLLSLLGLNPCLHNLNGLLCSKHLRCCLGHGAVVRTAGHLSVPSVLNPGLRKIATLQNCEAKANPQQSITVKGFAIWATIIYSSVPIKLHIHQFRYWISACKLCSLHQIKLSRAGTDKSCCFLPLFSRTPTAPFG